MHFFDAEENDFIWLLDENFPLRHPAVEGWSNSITIPTSNQHRPSLCLHCNSLYLQHTHFASNDKTLQYAPTSILWTAKKRCGHSASLVLAYITQFCLYCIPLPLDWWNYDKICPNMIIVHTLLSNLMYTRSNRRQTPIWKCDVNWSAVGGGGDKVSGWDGGRSVTKLFFSKFPKVPKSTKNY